MLLTAIAVTGGVFLHGSWADLRDCRQAGGVTGMDGPFVKLFEVDNFDGGRRVSLVLEMESWFLAGTACPVRKLCRLVGR